MYYGEVVSSFKKAYSYFECYLDMRIKWKLHIENLYRGKDIGREEAIRYYDRFPCSREGYVKWEYSHRSYRR